MQNCLIDKMYRFRDIVDLEQLYRMFEDFSHVTALSALLLSHPEQEVLVTSGHRDVCAGFHIGADHPEPRCNKGRREFASRLKEQKGPFIRQCPNGLTEGAAPVIVKGVHAASLFIGPVFFEQTDIRLLRKKPVSLGCDVDSCLQALVAVPTVTLEVLNKALSLLRAIAVMIADKGLAERASKC